MTVGDGSQRAGEFGVILAAVSPLDLTVFGFTFSLTLLAIASVVLGCIGLTVGFLAHVRLSSIRRTVTLLGGDHAERQAVDVEQMRREVAALRVELDQTRENVAGAVQKVSVVRYDAFPNMGGRLSFSAALLDDAGDGMVLTALSGRTESRTYAKGVSGGVGDQSLSSEEEQAVSFAMRGVRGSLRAKRG